jgi:Predicted membrane protein
MSNGRPDIFDRIMTSRVLRPLQPFYQKYKEPLLYLFFGSLAFFLSIGLFWAFTVPLGMNALTANVVDWVICVVFAYLTNRTWVFKNKAQDVKGIVRECSSFMLGRLGTLALEEAILWLGIDFLRINGMAVKIVAQVLVIVGNYVISKFFVFRMGGGGDEQ